MSASVAAVRSSIEPVTSWLEGGGGLDGGRLRGEAVGRSVGPQAQLELVGGRRLEIVGGVVVGRAVAVGRARLGQVLEVRVLGDVLGALEHHVLEQVRKTGP